MPEGDTVWRTAQRLHQALAGAELTRTELRWASLATTDLRGRHTVEVGSRGKHLLHRIEGGWTIHSHLRMEGQWRVASTAQLTAGQLADHQLRAVVGCREWTALGLRLGMLDLVPTDAEHTLVGHLGPDLLGPDWDPHEALRRLRASPAPIAAALLDQRNLAGIGTLYAAETLFLERVNPWTPAAELTGDTLTGIVARAHRLLTAGSRSAIQSTTGSARPGERTHVFARSGRVCRRCGLPVRVATIETAPHERVLFYCPTCQGGLAPTDDGGPQAPLGARSIPRPGRSGSNSSGPRYAKPPR